MYQTLYRKYRPTYFDEVVGQKVIIKTLKNAVENKKLNHAYLFTGPRGTGKTSVAKILAKTINCENINNVAPCNNCVSCTQINNKQSVDIIEIDAASNNGVDEIRELKSKVNLVPSIGKYKVYIIDEVHMLTTGAFNALLKTLEEPPEHIIFILATTEPHKIPSTILSRCQRFDFKKIHEKDIYERLKYIAQEENIDIEEQSLIELSRLADGGLRDALSLFDQVIAYSQGKITVNEVHEINGTLTPSQLRDFILFLSNDDIEKMFQLIDQYDQNGKNFVKLSEEIIIFLRNCLLAFVAPKYFEEINVNIDLYKIENLTKEKILNFIELFNQAIYNMKLSNFPKIILETTFISAMNIKHNIIKDEINKKEFMQEEMEQKRNNSSKQIKETSNIKDHNLEKKISIEKIKEIRINNTLCQFNKRELLDWKIKMKNLETELTNIEYGQLASFILDGMLKAVGHHHFIFVYDDEHLADLLNENIWEVDQLLEQVFHERISAIATNTTHWEIIKKEFNSKSKTYKYIEEPNDLMELLKNKKQQTELESMFENIIEYEN